jgi:exodeoxyribonuclease-3
VSTPLQKHIARSYILPEARHSDHCPVGVELNFDL